MNSYKICFNHIFHLHQCEYGTVFMMSQQLAFLCQTHGINTMRLKSDNSQIRTDGNNHQRQKQVIAACQLGNKEHPCQWGMHYSTHHTRHPHECEILFGQISRELKGIAEMRKDKPGNTTQIKRRRKNTTTTATTICSTGSKNFQ